MLTKINPLHEGTFQFDPGEPPTYQTRDDPGDPGCPPIITWTHPNLPTTHTIATLEPIQVLDPQSHHPEYLGDGYIELSDLNKIGQVFAAAPKLLAALEAIQQDKTAWANLPARRREEVTAALKETK